jgi:hypothetical protein
MNDAWHNFLSWKAIPFFVPGWLYLPLLWFGVPRMPAGINENLLSILLQIPALLGLAVLIPLVKGWTNWRQIGIYLVLPNVVLGLLWLCLLPSD